VKHIDRLAGSAPVRVLLTLAPYAVYAAVLGASLVTIGDGSVTGLRVHLRKGTRVPPGSHVLNPAGMPPHRVYEIERGRSTRKG